MNVHEITSFSASTGRNSEELTNAKAVNGINSISGSCGHLKQFVQLAEQIKDAVPNVLITGVPGRQASFEVQINEELVYSKLQTMAFPDFNEVTEVVKDVSQGKPVVKIQKQQPINCVIS